MMKGGTHDETALSELRSAAARNPSKTAPQFRSACTKTHRVTDADRSPAAISTTSLKRPGNGHAARRIATVRADASNMCPPVFDKAQALGFRLIEHLRA